MTKTMLPAGVSIRRLKPNRDERGWLTEVHRDSWMEPGKIVQWNAVYCKANTLRALHIHLTRFESYILVRGRAIVAFRDLRKGSPTEALVAMLDLDEAQPCAVNVPKGVMHGMLFTEESLLLTAFSAYYDAVDEQGVHWRDPDTGIVWPCDAPIISVRDATLPSLREYMRTHEILYERA